MQPVNHADLRAGAEALVLYDDGWWPARVTRVRGPRIKVDTTIMGSVVPQTVPERDVAVRLDPARHAPPPPGSRVLAAQQHDLLSAANLDVVAGAHLLGWRRGRVVAVRSDSAAVVFDPEPGESPADEPAWFPVRALACFVDVAVAASSGRLERVRGVIRGRGGSGPVLVSAEIRQGDETVVPRRTFAAPFELECEDGQRVRVEPGEWPRLSPTSRDRGSWDELQAHPLAAPFTDFAPGPHETFELSGEALGDGDEVEAVGELVAPGVLRPRMLAAGRKASAEVDEFLARLAPAAQPNPETPARGTWRSRGHFVPLALAGAAGLAWRLGDPTVAKAGVLAASAFLAIAAYHHRMIRPLTRFRRIAPARAPHFSVGGQLERGLNTGLIALYIAMGVAVLPLIAIFVASDEAGDSAWYGLAIVALWSVVLAAALLWREGPQWRALWILARAAPHRGPGAWGVSTGTFAAGATFTRRIDIHSWTTSRTVTDTVKTTTGGTTQVQREVTDHHSVGSRNERLPDQIQVTTAAGPLAVNGCTTAVWGTATPILDDLAEAEGTVTERIVERIAPGDSLLIFGRLRAESGRSIDNTGTGSLIIFGAPAGTDAAAVARRRLLGHTASLLLILAATVPALLAALTR